MGYESEHDDDEDSDLGNSNSNTIKPRTFSKKRNRARRRSSAEQKQSEIIDISSSDHSDSNPTQTNQTELDSFYDSDCNESAPFAINTSNIRCNSISNAMMKKIKSLPQNLKNNDRLNDIASHCDASTDSMLDEEDEIESVHANKRRR